MGEEKSVKYIVREGRLMVSGDRFVVIDREDEMGRELFRAFRRLPDGTVTEPVCSDWSDAARLQTAENGEHDDFQSARRQAQALVLLDDDRPADRSVEYEVLQGVDASGAPLVIIQRREGKEIEILLCLRPNEEGVAVREDWNPEEDEGVFALRVEVVGRFEHFAAAYAEAMRVSLEPEEEEGAV